MRVLVCGGRDYQDDAKLSAWLDARREKITVIIQGGAAGADHLALRWAFRNGVPCITVHAQWDHYGKAAGPIRNTWMLLHCRPDRVVAFPGGSGTKNMIEQAEAEGVKVVRAD